MKPKVLEEIEKLRNAGEINGETYWRLKRIIENPFEIDLGKIFDKYGIFGDSLVLDIAAGGSGTGPKILGENTIALDISREEISSAIKDGATAQWICADARKLPFKNNSLDFIVTFVGLAYISGYENKLAVLKEVYRALKKDGLILLVEPEIPEECQDYMKYFVIYKGGTRINETILGISGTDITQSQKLLAKLLNKAGFKVVIEKIGTLLVIAGRISNKT